MPTLLLSCLPALVACAPSPQETTMRPPSQMSATAARDANKTDAEDKDAAARGPAGQAAVEQASQGPVPVAVSAAENPAPAAASDLPARVALGRRTLSTAFVRLGPGEPLTVELRDGRLLVLRDVVMRRNDYCGLRVHGSSAGTRYCGGYGEVATARAGVGPVPENPIQ